MNRNDWIGLATSMLLHLLLVLVFGYITAGRPAEAQLGYVEVEFGEFSPGKPVEAEDKATQSSTPEPEPESEPEPVEEPEEVTDPEPEPVDEPDETPTAEETVPPTEEDPTPTPPETEPEDDPGADEQEPSEDPGEEQADPGDGTTDEKSAPYNIEGLDRDPVFAPLPDYSANVNARIRVQVTVDPQGRIVRKIPLMKGNPQLESSVLQALQRWRFNPLPAGAPQESQTGIITFTFRLE